MLVELGHATISRAELMIAVWWNRADGGAA